MPKPFTLYNTLSRSEEVLTPLHGPNVSMYTCGPTVYAEPHIGNFRAYIIQDVLVKTLRYLGYIPNRVMNITDVGHLTSDEDEGEDKLEIGAKREGKSAWEVARMYEALFLEDITKLRCEIPGQLVRATDKITEQITFIQGLEAKGFTYKTSDGIYFDTSKLDNYGYLARLDIAGLQAGARVEVSTEKQNITDFALWKFSPEGGSRDMEWESPWGIGFPGWHIECSAIILDTLGSKIDIHCGGVDHIPVHHTNEIAQSESLTGEKLAQIWFHNDFIQVDGGKMGKSLGNTYTLGELEARGFSALDFRYFTYAASYRSKLNFTWESLTAAKTARERLISLIRNSREGSSGTDYVERFGEILASDLNTSEVLALLWEVAQSDLLQEKKQEFFQIAESVLSLGLLDAPEIVDIPTAILKLVDERKEARRAGNWSESDRLRGEIESQGFQISDIKGEENPNIAKK